jgi:hypothetical protein
VDSSTWSRSPVTFAGDELINIRYTCKAGCRRPDVTGLAGPPTGRASQAIPGSARTGRPAGRRRIG